MAFVTTKDGVNIYYKDWGPKEAQPIVFHHGWPLSADDWDNQMLFFLAEGYRVIAIDRRGHGRSDQVSEGHDMDHYAADASAVVESLDLHNAVHVGHSTGGGQVARYVAKYGQPQGRVAKAVLVSAVPPLMVKTETNPGGTPIEVFDGFRKALAANRAQFYLDVASGPFYGFNRDGADVSQGTIQNWWRQGMIGSAKAHYEGIKAFSETDDQCRRFENHHRSRSGRADDRMCRIKMPPFSGQAAGEQRAENLSGFHARMHTTRGGYYQRGHSGLYSLITPRFLPGGAALTRPTPRYPAQCMNATRGWRCLFRLAIIQLGANVVQPGGVDAVRLPVHGSDQLFGAEF
jgi:pimeloyl-ACP methyl ester carboxylesterase